MTLSPDEQQAVLDWLHKGASPAAACQQLGLSIDQFWQTLATDAAFANRLQQAFDTLSQNVLAALYQAAMKGQLTAQQFWLRHRPPADWAKTTAGAGGDQDSLGQLADDELLERCRAAGVDLPPEIANRAGTTPRR